MFQVQGTPKASLVLCFCLCMDVEGGRDGKGQSQTREIRPPDQDGFPTHPIFEDGSEGKGSHKDTDVHVLGGQMQQMVCLGAGGNGAGGAHSGGRRSHAVQRREQERKSVGEQGPDGEWVE